MELPRLRDQTVTPPLQLESIAAVEDATGMDTESPTRVGPTDAMSSTGCIEPGVATLPGRSGESVPPNQIRRLSAVVDGNSELIGREAQQVVQMVVLQPKAGAMFVAQSICQTTASPRTIAEIRQKAQSDALREATQMFAERLSREESTLVHKARQQFDQAHAELSSTFRNEANLRDAQIHQQCESVLEKAHQHVHYSEHETQVLRLMNESMKREAEETNEYSMGESMRAQERLMGELSELQAQMALAENKVHGLEAYEQSCNQLQSEAHMLKVRLGASADHTERLERQLSEQLIYSQQSRLQYEHSQDVQEELRQIHKGELENVQSYAANADRLIEHFGYSVKNRLSLLPGRCLRHQNLSGKMV